MYCGLHTAEITLKHGTCIVGYTEHVLWVTRNMYCGLHTAEITLKHGTCIVGYTPRKEH